MGVKSTIFKQTRLDVFLIAKKKEFWIQNFSSARI